MEYISNNNKQKIISIIQDDFDNLGLMLNDEYKRKINISSNITVVTSITNPNSILIKQLSYNNIEYKVVNEFNYTEVLKNIETEYALVLLGNDAIIVDDIDIQTNLAIFAGTPLYVINPYTEFKTQYLHNVGRNKFTNPYCCLINRSVFTDSMFLNAIQTTIDTNMYYNEKSINLYFHIHKPDLYFKLLNFIEGNMLTTGTDSNNNYFSTFIFGDNTIREWNNKRYIDFSDSVNEHQ